MNHKLVRSDHRGGRSTFTSLVTMAASLVAVMALPPALASRAAERAPRLGRAVQVRLDDDLDARLTAIEDHARGLGRSGFSRSQMVRDAVSAYVGPLIECLDADRAPDTGVRSRLPASTRDHETFGETTRVRFDPDLVDQLDRVEAHARGLGYRHVTRSSLIREGVKSYLAGFDAELAQPR